MAATLHTARNTQRQNCGHEKENWTHMICLVWYKVLDVRDFPLAFAKNGQQSTKHKCFNIFGRCAQSHIFTKMIRPVFKYSSCFSFSNVDFSESGDVIPHVFLHVHAESLKVRTRTKKKPKDRNLWIEREGWR